MPPSSRPHLATVVVLEVFDGKDRPPGSGTGFLCHARHYRHRTRKLLFLVTNAHGVGRNRQRIDVHFQPREGDEAVIYSVTAKSGTGPVISPPCCWIQHTSRRTKLTLAASTWRPTRSPFGNSGSKRSWRGPRGCSWDS